MDLGVFSFYVFCQFCNLKVYNFKYSYSWNILRFTPIEKVDSTEQDCHSKCLKSMPKISTYSHLILMSQTNKILPFFSSYSLKALFLLPYSSYAVLYSS